MKTPALIIALLFSTAAAAGAASAADANAAPGAQSPQQPTRLAGWFEVGDREQHGERRHHGRHRDDDDGERHGGHHGDDDRDRDRDGDHAGRGGENRPADPNAANAPVPDNGVFNGEARPKVEVQ